jgi:putative tricarboxylic transport membrane protein
LSNDNATTGTGEERTETGFSSLVHRTDLTLAVVILAVCGVLFYLTTRFEKVPAMMSQNIPPEWFPRILIWVIVLLTVIIPFEHLMHKKGKKHLDEDRSSRIKPISIYSAILLCCIVVSMPWLGTFLTLILVCTLLPILWGEKRVKVLLPFAILFPGLVALLFTKVLGVFFEPGIWSKLF